MHIISGHEAIANLSVKLTDIRVKTKVSRHSAERTARRAPDLQISLSRVAIGDLVM